MITDVILLVMNETEFTKWLDQRNVPTEVRADLFLAQTHVSNDSMAGEMLDDFDGIVEYTDYAIFELTPYDVGFIVFGSCPNGDPIAIDVKAEIGRILYLSHEDIDENGFPSQVVSPSMGHFIEMVNADKMPLDYYEAIGWGNGGRNAG